MKTGRDDWDAMIRASGIPEAEPVFVLRAQDPSAAQAVREWAAIALADGCPVAIAEQALRQADQMERWPIKKPPGDDRLTEADRKQLEYAHSRRAWNLSNTSLETAWKDLALELAARVIALGSEMKTRRATAAVAVARRLLSGLNGEATPPNA